jgi:hypothetical protein
LFLLTGGVTVGASFMLASVVTDRAFVRSVDDWRRPVSPAVTTGLDALARVAPLAGVLGLVFVLVTGLTGPTEPTRNPAVLVVWVGWWAGYVISVYALGNSWPALNPFRAIAERLPSLDLTYPERLGAWPAVVGLLGLVFVEVVTPLASDPRLLATVVAGYGLLVVAGSVAFGVERFFGTIDPVSRVFEYFGRVAPVSVTRAKQPAVGGTVVGASGEVAADGGRERTISLRLPGMGLTDARGVDGPDEVAFVVGVVWVTSYDGLVTTPAWAGLVRFLVEGPLGGFPTDVAALAVYVVALLAGYLTILGAYRGAAHLARRTGDTYLTARVLARRFAPSLLAIAAGYHLAHFLGYFISLSPALVGSLLNPVSPPAPLRVVLPGWFGGLELAFVLVGHLLAIWVAHAAAFDRFPGRLQAVRSQYPFVAVMVAYTMLSLWIVAEPELVPPYLG